MGARMITKFDEILAEREKRAEAWDMDIPMNTDVKTFSDKLIAQLRGEIPIGEGKIHNVPVSQIINSEQTR